MRKLSALLLFLLASPVLAAPKIAITFSDGSLQPGTTMPFHTAAGIVDLFKFISANTTGNFILNGATIAWTNAVSTGTRIDKTTATFSNHFNYGTVTDYSTRTFQGARVQGTLTEGNTVAFDGARHNGTITDNVTRTFEAGASFEGSLTDNADVEHTGAHNFSGGLSFDQISADGVHAGSITASGQVYFGTGTTRAIVGATPRLQVEGLDFDNSSMSLIRNQDNTGAPGFVFSKTRGTTVGAVTTVANNDILGTMYFAGADGTGIVQGARIQVIVDGTVGTNVMPSEMLFQTSPDGSATPTTKMVISPNGEITKPLQPSFLVERNTQQVNATGDTTLATITFNVETFDQGGDIANSTFTAPVTGRYQFNMMCDLRGLISGTHTALSMFFVTSNGTFRKIMTADTGDMPSVYGVGISVLTDMDVNDTAYVQIRVDDGTKVVDIFADGSNRYTFFSGYLAN